MTLSWLSHMNAVTHTHTHTHTHTYTHLHTHTRMHTHTHTYTYFLLPDPTTNPHRDCRQHFPIPTNTCVTVHADMPPHPPHHPNAQRSAHPEVFPATLAPNPFCVKKQFFFENTSFYKCVHESACMCVYIGACKCVSVISRHCIMPMCLMCACQKKQFSVRIFLLILYEIFLLMSQAFLSFFL